MSTAIDYGRISPAPVFDPVAARDLPGTSLTPPVTERATIDDPTSLTPDDVWPPSTSLTPNGVWPPSTSLTPNDVWPPSTSLTPNDVWPPINGTAQGLFGGVPPDTFVFADGFGSNAKFDFASDAFEDMVRFTSETSNRIDFLMHFGDDSVWFNDDFKIHSSADDLGFI